MASHPLDPTMVTRRGFLRIAGGGAIAVGLVACSSSGTGTRATSPAPGAPFREPEQLASSNGSLAVTLVAQASQVPFGNARRFAYTYNGTTPGPTLRLRPGDVLTITLVNRLGESTNLHTHGLHVSPSGSSDNIFVDVPSGGRHTYIYKIPADHPSGLFWYHPHVHPSVAPQLFGGLAGAILIEDATDSIPAIAEANERLFVLADPRIGTSASIVDASMAEQMRGREGDVILVNGVLSPRLEATAGSLERWRILNASASRYYQLSLEGHRLHAIATDGGRLRAPVGLSNVLLAPGERIEVMVTPTSAGTYRLRTTPYDRGRVGMGSSPPSSGTAETVATLSVLGSGPAAALPASLANFENLSAVSPDGQRSLALAMGMGRGAGMGGGGGGGGGASFTIDGRTFDPTRIDTATHLGRVEDWVVNNTSTMDHPFHLHVWPFQIVERSDGLPSLPGRKDVVNVPAGQSVKIRIRFVDYPGRAVYHCHILDHEDLGMMGVINVAES